MKNITVALTIILTFSLLTIGSAQNFALNSVGGRVGVVFPEDWDTGFYLGATANVGEITDNLEMYPSLSYWSAGFSEAGVDLSLSNIQIAGDIHYFLENVQGLYFGGGISINFFSFDFPSVEVIYDPVTGLPVDYRSTTDSESKTKFGIGVLAGYEIPIGNNMGFVEGKYNIISDFGTFELGVGILFDISK